MNYSRRQLYAAGEPLGESVTRKEGGRIIYGGGGSSQPSSQTQISELPDWAKGYAKDTLAKTGALTDINQNPYQAYGANRIAGFDPMQVQSQQNAANMQTAPQTQTATNMAEKAGLAALNTQYQNGQFQNQFQAPGRYDPAQVNMYTAQAPNLQQYQMDPAQQVRTRSFAAPGSAEAYMSPYMQNVVDVQQREAQRQADIAGTQLSSQATKSGAFGGGRQAVMQAEAARNLAQQKGDIQATGSQAAYQQAQQQFNAEQAARLQAQQANQSAGINVGSQNLGARLGVQQLGSGQSMQAQLANQQALQAAQQLAEQSRQYGAGYGMTAAQNAAQYGQAAQQLGEQSRQYGAGLGMQGLQTALQGAGQLGTLGGQQFAQGMDINKLQNAYGGQRQALEQQGLSQKYQDFQEQKNYPYKQLGFMSDMIRGLPLGQQSTKQVYEAEPGLGSQLVGAGTAAYGLSKFMAVGGITGDAKVSSMLEDLTDEQLQQSRQIAEQSRDQNRIDMIDKEIARRAQAQPAPGQGGIASATSDEMMDRMLPTEASMARGGIVAFAAPNVDNNYSLVTDPQFGGSTGEIAENRPKLTRDQVNAIVQALRDSGKPVGLSDIIDIEAGRLTAPSKTTINTPAAPAANPEGLGNTPEAKKAAVMPPDIGAGRERPAMTTAASTGGKDLMQVQEDIFNRMKKSDKGDPYAAQTKELGDLLIKQKEDEKTALLADQAKFATAYDGREKRLDARKADITKREDQNLATALIFGGATIMSTPGGLAKAIGKGAKVGTEAFASGLEKIQTAKDLLDKSMDDLEDLRLNRSEMSAKEIRMANSNISGARIEAKKLINTGVREAGAETRARANTVTAAVFAQLQNRENNAAADRRAAAAANRPGAEERMMKDLGDIGSGKASYMGKTGEEGVKAYKENRAAVGGVRYTGPTKAAAYTPGDAQLVKGLADQVSLLSGNTDPKNVARVKVLEDKIAAIDKKYTGAGAGGGALNKPSQEAFMEAARKLNPGVSDAELEAYYADNYK